MSFSRRNDLCSVESSLYLSSWVKRSMDIVGSSILLILLSPVFLFVGSAVALESRSFYVLFRHKRLGKDGVEFKCLKFRSMVPNAEEILSEVLANNHELWVEWESTRKLKKDPRVTKLGAILRRSSLDELPQLINVLQGSMSLVGPRPIVTEESGMYGQYFSFYAACRPGLTGAWQASGRSDLSYPQRVKLDVDYAKNASLLLDFSIMIGTVKSLFGRSGAY